MNFSQWQLSRNRLKYNPKLFTGDACWFLKVLSNQSFQRYKFQQINLFDQTLWTAPLIWTLKNRDTKPNLRLRRWFETTEEYLLRKRINPLAISDKYWLQSSLKNDKVVILTHFWPMIPFYTPWKTREYKMGTLVRNGLTRK